jgi:hypothetical protein
MTVPAGRGVAGIPPGLVDPVIEILGASSSPVRRRILLEELERRGHRISLAGLNRILQHLSLSGRTVEAPGGVRLRPRGESPAPRRAV